MYCFELLAGEVVEEEGDTCGKHTNAVEYGIERKHPKCGFKTVLRINGYAQIVGVVGEIAYQILAKEYDRSDGLHDYTANRATESNYPSIACIVTFAGFSFDFLDNISTEQGGE